MKTKANTPKDNLKGLSAIKEAKFWQDLQSPFKLMLDCPKSK